MLRVTLKLLVAGALLIYPVAIYLADGYLAPNQLLAGLLLLIAGRLLVIIWLKRENRLRNSLICAALIVAAVLAILLFSSFRIQWLRFYPIFFNIAAFAVFFSSLFTGMPLVERMARLINHDFPQQAIGYTRRVTWVWSIILLLNTFVSLYTAFGTSFRFWSLYNGVIMYVLFGAVFLVEYLVRTWLRRKWAAA